MAKDNEELHPNAIIEELASDKYYEVEVIVTKVFTVKVKDVEDAEDLVLKATEDAMDTSELEVSSGNDGYDQINVLGEVGDTAGEDLEVEEEYYDR
jgi:hypothetical protein